MKTCRRALLLVAVATVAFQTNPVAAEDVYYVKHIGELMFITTGMSVVSCEFSHTNIHKDGRVFSSNHHILGLYVSMKYASLVKCCYCFDNVEGYSLKYPPRWRRFISTVPLIERLTVNPFQQEKISTIVTLFR